MKIGELAERACVPAKTIRYYEEVGLINQPERMSNGYRSYADDDVHILQFVSQARRLGFSSRPGHEFHRRLAWTASDFVVPGRWFPPRS